MRCDPFWLFFGRDPLCIGDDASIVPYAKPPAAAPLHADMIQYIISDAPVGRNFAKSSKLGRKNRPEPLDGFGIIVLAVWASDC